MGQVNVKLVWTMENIIYSLEGKSLNGYALHVDNVSSGRFIEETNFELYLEATDGRPSETPVVKGKYFSGRGEVYTPWLETYYDNRVKFKSSKVVDLSERGLDEELVKHLSNLLPAGSHIMVAYLNHEETRNALERGVPAPATPLGRLLWKAGCTWFKDWYFAEGFREGDIKLQGNKPLNEEHRRKDLLETRKELTRFLREEKGDERSFWDARRRAKDVLKDIAREMSTS